MITFWQQEKHTVINRSEKELDSSLNTWIDVRSVTREDIRILEEEYHIEQEDILDILDQDELSRIEREDNYTLIIMRLPVFIADNDISYFTLPVGIVIMKNIIITICWTDSEVLNDFSSNRIRSLSLNDFPAMVIRLLSRSDTVFLRYLKEINRRASTIQNELERSVKNNELLQLLNLQKSLEYFQTSLKGNQMLLEKLTRTKVLPLDEEDKDWLEDVNIDNRQALEMADTYSNILSGMTDTFASVISNNLNIVMKRLTSISLIMMVPTFIASFFGMNVPLPFEHDGWLGVIIIGIICLVTAIVTNFFLSDRRMSGGSKTSLQKKNMINSEKTNKRDSYKIKKLIPLLLLISSSFCIFAQQAETFTGIKLIQIKSSLYDTKFVIGENIQSITDERNVQPFYMNAFETSYTVWYTIRNKAELELEYVFQNPGQEGSEGKRGKAPTMDAKWEPVTTINWRDAIVWCNALSEIEDRTPCYTYNAIVLRDSTNAAQIDLCICNYQADGYRLPTETEWEYAARKTGNTFQDGNLVSGAITKEGESNPDALETDYCWNELNSTGTANIGTAGSSFGINSTPGSGNANGMHLFDMSGNVLEFCNDWHEEYYKPSSLDNTLYYDGPQYGNARVSRGGSWNIFASYCYCGDRYAYDPDESYNYMGFRFCTTRK